MNAPDRFEPFGEGQRQVIMALDTKIPNAATFTVHREDHTLANMLRMQLLKNPKVLFAGYQVPHPLEAKFVLKVQTTPDTSPLDILQQEVERLLNEIQSLKVKFESEVSLQSLR